MANANMTREDDRKQLAKRSKNRSYQDFPTITDCIEHFRLIRILHKHTIIPSDYLDHIENQLRRFKKTKGKAQDQVAEIRTIIRNVHDKEFQTARHTRKTKEGVQIGKFFIKIQHGPKKTFDILDYVSRDNYVIGLRLYETAYMITHRLSTGMNMDHAQIQDILNEHTVYTDLITEIYNKKQEMRQLSDDQTAQNKAKIAFEEVKTRCTDLRNIINDKYKDEINQLKD
jgi:hypothetical protein